MFTSVYPKTTNGGLNAQGKLTSAEWNGFIEELVGEFEYTPIATVGIIVEPIQGDGAPDLSAYALKSWVEAKGYLTAQNLTGYATEEYVNNAVSAATGADLTSYLTKSEAATLYQPVGSYLTSQSLKTINGESIVGTGDITISGGGGGSVTVDSALSNSSTNPVQNKVIYSALQDKVTRTDVGQIYAGNIEMLTDGYGKYYGIPEDHVRDEADYILATEDYVDEAVSAAYSKPSDGIPKTDLASAVQTSLGKADTALQAETDPIFVASVAYGITQTDINNWNAKTSNVGTITGITMNGVSKGTSGVVDLGTVITSHQQLKTINGESLVGSGNITIQGGGSGDVNIIEVVKVNGTALTPDANKAVNITVPAAITESTVSGWGFTKNTGTVSSLSDLGITATATELNYVDGVTSNIQEQLNAKGTYSKPSGGIPKTDLASAVQTSLGKADTALQSFTESDPTVPSHVKSITTTDISNWNNKLSSAPVTSVNGQTGAVTLTIPSAVTESTVAGWGFTKNTGTYSKPSGGIPKTDLASAVQTSLGLADSALQSESDPVFTASAAHSITTTNISNWNGVVTTIAGYGDIVTHNASEFQTKITVSSSQPSGGSNGDIWIVV